MASNHVPSDQVQNVYTDPSYQNLFPSVDRYGTPSWEAQLHQHQGLPPNVSGQSWHHSPYAQQPYSAPSQSYGGQTHGLRTASPYQYGQFGQQGPIGNYGQTPNVDPSLGLDPSAIRQQQQSPYQMPMRTLTPQGHGGTVTPQALQHNAPLLQQPRTTASPYELPKSTAEIFAQPRATPPSLVKPVRVPEYDIPKGRKSGGLYVLDQAALAKATKSTALNKFVTLGSEPFHLATNRTALPVYVPRHSLKDLKKAGADSKKLRAKQLASKSQSRALKFTKKSAELKREVSDDESSTESSDYDSDSSDDEEEEQMPVPASRPEDPDAAVRYDVVKATWHPSTSSPSSEKIKTSMRDIWEVLNTIQKRWRADSKAVSEAEEQKKTGELPVLKSRVTSQRDLLKSALEAALESAHPDVLYQLGQIKPFLYMCYQFLANRFHSKDYDGPLSAVVYEVLSRCGTLTSELLEETKLIKALTSMKKHANEKHKAFIQQVIDGAAVNSKKAKVSPPPRAESTESKGIKRPATESAARSMNEAPSMKKPRPAESLANAIKMSSSKTATASSNTTTQKRPGERPGQAPAPVKTRVSQVANKPSGIFASLTAASKKPTPASAVSTGAKPSSTASKAYTPAAREKKLGATTTKPAFSFAQTMASLQKPKEQEAAPVKSEKPLPTETPEEKSRRLRKESRRHLRVAWRPAASLVEIKYFDHGQDDEEMDHKEDHLVRDAGDIGGEGHMFKQHKELDLDDDEEDLDTEHKSWAQPSLVDFSVLPPDERKRHYAPFGGGQMEPSCPEKEANAQRENATLMVYYSNSDDIPPSPQEPAEQAQETTSGVAVTHFGPPPEYVLKRCPQPSVPATMPDLRQLESVIKQFSTTNQPPVTMPVATAENGYTPPPASIAPPMDALNLQNILTSLNSSQAAQQPPPVPYPVPGQVQQPGVPVDFAAILAQVQAAVVRGDLPPAPPLPPYGSSTYPLAFPPQPQQHEPTAWPQQMHEVSAYQPQYNQQANGGTKRQRDDGNSNDRKAGKRAKTWDHKPHKVLQCKFYLKGQCSKGENCTYIHDQN
ncbi:hypothetical protein BDW02DRAFT_504998 [Decorospora gaudefroyi]|uniref:C3H1-type domain-containing protein n=1 Tax=Decorospora gaudefroyi TaxID=184978 RepID=A0A6A5KDP3_9PLEO|nr:hypothetical protein BDW02DRAFT_504998 [Decorospora gaudefroyi]